MAQHATILIETARYELNTVVTLSNTRECQIRADN